jgi:hypothetical protein
MQFKTGVLDFSYEKRDIRYLEMRFITLAGRMVRRDKSRCQFVQITNRAEFQIGAVIFKLQFVYMWHE